MEHVLNLLNLKKKTDRDHSDTSIQPPVPDKQQYLLAFRSITLMLSLIHSRRRVSKRIDKHEETRRHLKPLDALAALAIRQHGIAAATMAIINSAAGTLEVVASSEYAAPTTPISSPTTSLNLWTKILFYLTLNPRNDRLLNHAQERAGQPSKIVDPETEIPKILTKCSSDLLLKTYLKQVWPKRDEALDKSFYTHIWMINELLKRKDDSRSFLLYAIASCYLKMLIRMEYRTSETIRATLKRVSTFDFSEKAYAGRTSEKDNDVSFLHTFLRYKSLLKPQTDTPNLTRRAETLPHEHDFYTQETCLEFHQLLSELLGRLYAALKTLDLLRGKDEVVDTILIQLELIARLGYLVRLMVKGTAIKKHLRVIENFLPDRPALQAVEQADEEQEQDVDGDGDGDGDADGCEGGDDDGSDSDSDEDSEDVEAHKLPKWEMWSDCLEIMVIHFDSTQVLHGFVKSYAQPESESHLLIEMKVLWKPLPSTQLLKWKDLMHMIALPDVASGLIKFLEPEVISRPPPPTVEDCCRLIYELHKISRAEVNVVVFADAVDHVASQLKELSNYSIPWSEPTITSLVNKLHSLKDTWMHTTDGDLITEIKKISKKIRVLMKSPPPNAEEVSVLVSALGKIAQVKENQKVFASTIDNINLQMKSLTDYTVPWSQPSIITMIDTLDNLKDTWLHTSKDDLTNVITKISHKVRNTTKHSKSTRTAEEVGELVAKLGKIPQVKESTSIFDKDVDYIITQVKVLVTPLPWSEPLITSIIGKLDLFREMWKRGTITKKDMNVEISNIAEGIKTLTTRPTAEDLGRMVKKLVTIPRVPLADNEVVFVNSVDHIIFQMGALTNCSSPWSGSFIRSIIDKLNKFKILWKYTCEGDTKKELAEVAEMIKTLRDNARLFYALEESEPLCTGVGFKGTDHCESGLVAYYYAHADWFNEAPGMIPVGVSKRCCPSCARLLKKLKRFTYTHSHTTITACSLPESLPLVTIVTMVHEFGGQLIKELRRLKERTDMLTSLDPSIGSGKVSLGSGYPSTDLLGPGQ